MVFASLPSFLQPRRPWLVLGLVALGFPAGALAAGADNAGPLWRPVNYFVAAPEATWTASGGAVVLTRSNPASASLLNDTATGAELANARDFDFDWNVGPDLSLRRRLGDDWGLELRHVHVADLEARQQFTAPGPFEFPSNPPTQSPLGADVDVNYATRVYSSELNLRARASDWCTWLAGFRWLELHENLTYQATLPFVSSQVELDTDNHLYGAQTGADLHVWDRGGPLTFDALFKGGVYGTAARNRIFNYVEDSSGAVIADREFFDTASPVSFVGEIGLVGRYALSESWSLRAGYQLLWITDVALASDQIAAIDFLGSGTGIDSSGDVLFHGALFGLEWRR